MNATSSKILINPMYRKDFTPLLRLSSSGQGFIYSHVNFFCYALPFKHKTWIGLKSQIAAEHWVVLRTCMTGLSLCFCVEVSDINRIKCISTAPMFLLPKCSFRTVLKCRKPPASLEKPCLCLFISDRRSKRFTRHWEMQAQDSPHRFRMEVYHPVPGSCQYHLFERKMRENKRT